MEKILKYVYKSKGLKITLITVSHAATVASVAQLFLLLYVLYAKSSMATVIAAFTLFIALAIVSIARRAINAKRPYELLSFCDENPKKKSGRSFPSRHAFSAFAIAVASLGHLQHTAVLLLILGALMCVSRVLLGMHFIRDVIAGSLIGIISGSITGYLISIAI